MSGQDVSQMSLRTPWLRCACSHCSCSATHAQTEHPVSHEQAIFDLEATNQELKGDLRDLYITGAKEVEVATARKAIVIHVRPRCRASDRRRAHAVPGEGSTEKAVCNDGRAGLRHMQQARASEACQRGRKLSPAHCEVRGVQQGSLWSQAAQLQPSSVASQHLAVAGAVQVAEELPQDPAAPGARAGEEV